MLKEIAIASGLLLGSACDSFGSKPAVLPAKTLEPSPLVLPTQTPTIRKIYLPSVTTKNEDEQIALSFTQMVFAGDEKRIGEMGFPGLAESIAKTTNEGCQIGVIGKVSEDSTENEIRRVTISVVEDCNKGPQALVVEVTERTLDGKSAVIGFDIHK